MTFKTGPLEDLGEMAHQQQKHTKQLGLHLYIPLPKGSRAPQRCSSF